MNPDLGTFVRACRRRWRRPWLIGVAALAAVLSACTLITLRDESASFYASTVLVGRVDCVSACAGPVRVAAYPVGQPQAPAAHRVLLHEPGGYELIVPPGRYVLEAFDDRDRNGRPDPGEARGRHGEAVTVTPGGAGVVPMLDIVLAPEAPPLPERPDSGLPPPVHSTQAGALIDLAAPAFSAENGRRGYWAPVAFFREVGGNIFFLEPYDPRRIPVLFIHGAAGSAQDWRQVIDRLDRTRYQPWVFVYPSGAAVESMAYLLYWKLLNLQLRHHFDALVITAHSMGGLVARSFLVHHGVGLPQVRLFVSLSTPWGGEPSADLGVKASPAVVPSWRDMQPDGPFMQTLFARPLPPQLAHVLFFGHRGGYSLLRPNHDGTVTLASQLRPPAQAEANLVLGFDEDHDSILRSPAVVDQLHAVLRTHGSGKPGPARAGRVTVRLDLPSSRVSAWGVPVLLFRPIDGGEDGAGTQGAVAPLRWLQLAPDARDQTVGPIPAGAYRMSVVAGGYRTEPRWQTVTIGDGDRPATVEARLIPDGTLNGYVSADADALGTPAGAWQRPHPTLRLRSVTLRGPGIERVLRPTGSDRGDDLLAAYAAGEDRLDGPGFLFVGLPAGAYELTLDAPGYRPHVARHVVVPGAVTSMTPIRLVPEPREP